MHIIYTVGEVYRVEFTFNIYSFVTLHRKTGCNATDTDVWVRYAGYGPTKRNPTSAQRSPSKIGALHLFPTLFFFILFFFSVSWGTVFLSKTNPPLPLFVRWENHVPLNNQSSKDRHIE